MRKTIALFGFALTLLIAALVIGLRQPAKPTTPVQVPQPVVVVPTPPIQPTVDPGRSVVSIGEVVKLDGSLSNSFLRAGETGALSLLVDLVARNSGATVRSPMAVAIVIDRSGSMAGEKIRQARQAAKAFASRLGDDDQLSIVTYSSDYSVDLPLTTVKGQRNRIERVIDEILDGGGTDIGSGLQAGLQTLRNASNGAVKRLLLVSDGNANQGITDTSALVAIGKRGRQDGVTVSSLGVGVDFNEDLLTQMSQSAGGGYYYARDAEAIATAFDKELSGLTKLAAQNVEVGLELGTGVTISEVYGYRTEMRRGRVVIPVGDMAAGEHRRVLVQLATNGAPEGRMDVTNVVLSYTTAGTEDTREHQAPLTIGATKIDRDIADGERREVTEAFEAAKAARARELAATSYQNGNKGQAVTHLKQQIATTRAKNNQLKSIVLEEQVLEMEEALRGINTSAADSDDGKDLVKREKLRARQVFAY